MTIWKLLAAIWCIGVALHINRLKKHPSAENEARMTAFVIRIKCSLLACGAFVAILLIPSVLLSKLTQNTALFFDAPMALVKSPAFITIAGIASWFVAPALMKVLPASTFSEGDDEESAQPKPRTLPPELTKTDPGVINLDPEAFEQTDDVSQQAHARDSRDS